MSKCLHCGADFAVEAWKLRHGKGKYCSVKCRSAARRKRADVTCGGCGKTFQTWSSHASRRVFCSHRCKHPNRDDLRFNASIDRTESCWNWTATIAENGYGRFTPYATHRARLAHRMAYEKWVGQIPSGLQIDHLCRNRRCVNPEHLEAVTGRENVRRALIARRSADTVIHVRRSA